MDSIIVGTAGHIDHGKTSLIKALNGFDGDNLKEEQEKGITINLSFSHLKNSNTNLAFIDVPGHENLIKTMISGAFAFKICLFVIDINEGLKAQSIEHLKVLEFLGVKDIILILSKVDLCENIEFKKNTILKELQSYKINLLKIFLTSIYDKKSTEELKKYLLNLNPKKCHKDFVFRYFIDRVFSLKGIGTIVTGSLNEGKISKNEKIYCIENQKDIIVKNIQIHDINVDQICAYNRVALNLNCNYYDLKKGYILTKKGLFRSFKSIDVLIFSNKIKHKSELEFCTGSKKVNAKLNIIKEFENKTYATLDFEKNLALCFDDRFILLENRRVKSGGIVLNSVSEPLKKDAKIQFLELLEQKEFNAIFEFLKDTHKFGFGLLSSYQRFKLTHQEALKLAKNLSNVFIDEKGLNVYNLKSQDELKNFIEFIFSKNKNALISANSISLRLSWASEEFCAYTLKQMQDFLDFKDGIYFLKGQDFEKLKEKNYCELFEILKKEGIRPTAPYNLYEQLGLDRKNGDTILKKLTKENKVIRLTHNIFIEKQALNLLMDNFLLLLKTQNLDVNFIKNYFKISRKYAIAYLEYLDNNFKQVKKINEKRMLKC
ncbi:selenocysteine-specific translation elongation factor [Campylobacter insulaenigrae]|uniref:selenocysteine-specific translation elongation factor n=1 Tax=Campylobacter insulaenigrae TaxID=260714 RepID=UPI002152799F|nr:selenocysteine-specific translation elongation factor [Campylobacter insulaenigrae]MCR6578655.1 selenocysteine-specific translation elongation factor [Campylobacter insulaenigrae]